MDKEILEIIDKNMPAMVGEALKARLQQADEDKAQLAHTTKLYKEKCETIRDLEAQKDKLREALNKHVELEKREDAVREREIKQEVELLKVQIEAQKRIASAGWEFLNTLAKNPTVKESVYRSIHNGSTYNNGGTQYYPTGDSETRTTETE